MRGKRLQPHLPLGVAAFYMEHNLSENQQVSYTERRYKGSDQYNSFYIAYIRIEWLIT